MSVLWIYLALGAWCFGELSGDTLDNDSKATEFSRFVDAYWKWRLEQNPEYATRTGSDIDADKWQSLTEDAFRQDMDKALEFLSKSDDIKPEYLSEVDAITYKVIRSSLMSYTNGYKYRKYTQYNPITPLDYPSRDWMRVFGWMPKETLTDYENIIKRCIGLDTQITEMIALMEEAIRRNTTQHWAALTGASEHFKVLLSSIANKTSFFHKTLDVIPDSFSEQQVGNITRNLTAAIDNVVQPAIQRFKNFIDQKYIPNTRTIPGVFSLANGQELYQECLNWHLDAKYTAKEVYDLGISEVKRIEENIQVLMDNANFNGSMQDYLTYLKTLKENYYTTEEAMLNGYREIILTAEEQLYKVLPDLNIDCPVVVEQNMNPQGWARYEDPSPDMSTPGTFIINVFNPETRPTFGMTSLTLHETIPGHHMQACYIIAGGGEQKGRKVTFLRYYAAPFNFPFFTSFAEGWALYAEFLGEEMGVYDTPNKKLGRYLNEIFRAARLVVDTGIHAFGWSRQRAIDYLASYSTRSMSDIENEINRYISWPGQACSYKIGELKIRELRKKAEAELGPLFDKRYFHKEILKLGSVPLSVMEDHMNQWIKRGRERPEPEVSASGHIVFGIPIMLCGLLFTYLL